MKKWLDEHRGVTIVVAVVLGWVISEWFGIVGTVILVGLMLVGAPVIMLIESRRENRPTPPGE